MDMICTFVGASSWISLLTQGIKNTLVHFWAGTASEIALTEQQSEKEALVLEYLAPYSVYVAWPLFLSSSLFSFIFFCFFFPLPRAVKHTPA